MNLCVLVKIHLLISVACLCLQARADDSRSVAFLDSMHHRYFRSHTDSELLQINSVSLSEVAATVSVLLGVEPPPLLTVESSAKLDKILLPNPFERPHAVFMLEVKGIGDLSPSVAHSISPAVGTISTAISGSNKAEIQLYDEDQVNVVSLDAPLECGTSCTDKELGDLAHWLGGLYLGTLESLNGELTFPLASGSSFKLHVSKKADLAFALGLVSLVRGVKRAVEMHEDLAGSTRSPAELMTGCFTGIEALNEYGQGVVAQQGMELFQTTLAKLFDLLQKSWQGEIVGVILFNKEPSADLGSTLDVQFSARISRLLEEVDTANATSAEVLLVRRSLAWITGIILLVSTLIGIYLLLNMPLTRDTLLYSNVKLD